MIRKREKSGGERKKGDEGEQEPLRTVQSSIASLKASETRVGQVWGQYPGEMKVQVAGYSRDANRLC